MKEEKDSNPYSISTDKSKLQLDVIHGFLSNSYWAKNISVEKIKTCIDNSICYGVYHHDKPFDKAHGKQVGYARVVTDYAVIAYIGDVFIVEEHRGKGLSKMLMKEIVAHPELQNIRRWVLATRDAHGLYEQVGFKKLTYPERWMERPRADAY